MQLQDTLALPAPVNWHLKTDAVPEAMWLRVAPECPSYANPFLHPKGCFSQTDVVPEGVAPSDGRNAQGYVAPFGFRKPFLCLHKWVGTFKADALPEAGFPWVSHTVALPEVIRLHVVPAFPAYTCTKHLRHPHGHSAQGCAALLHARMVVVVCMFVFVHVYFIPIFAADISITTFSSPSLGHAVCKHG